MQRIAVAALVMNTFLWGTYQAVTRDVVQRISPLDLAAAELASLLPAIIVILIATRRQMSWMVARAGIISGGLLVVVVLTTMTALKFTMASEAAAFPALNGLFAALIARSIYGTTIRGRTWLAAGLAVVGIVMLSIRRNVAGEQVGNLLALVGAFIYTCYVFRVDRDTGEQRLPVWPLFALELLVTVVVAVPVAVAWGDPLSWRAAGARDIGAAVYIGYATMFVPTMFAILFQRYVRPVSVSFIYILEPVWGVLIALVWLREHPPAATLAGVGLLIAAAATHWTAAG